jgi:hypothetical protein
MNISETLVQLHEELLYLKTAIFRLEQVQAGAHGWPGTSPNWLAEKKPSANNRTPIRKRQPAAFHLRSAMRVTEQTHPETSLNFEGSFLDMLDCSPCGEGSQRFVDGRPLCVECAETRARPDQRQASPEPGNPPMNLQTRSQTA